MRGLGGDLREPGRACGGVAVCDVHDDRERSRSADQGPAAATREARRGGERRQGDTDEEQRAATKRGGEFHLTAIPDDATAVPDATVPDNVEEIGEALETLGHVHPELANLVDLHFFCGFGLAEIAQVRGVSERTVQRDWRKARLLLHRVIGDS